MAQDSSWLCESSLILSAAEEKVSGGPFGFQTFFSKPATHWLPLFPVLSLPHGPGVRQQLAVGMLRI